MTSATETCEPPTPVPPAGPDPTADWPVTVVERRPGWRPFDLRELWRFRELLYFLTWRDVKVRYKQTALGAAWAVLQPLATMVVFALFLGRAAGLTRDLPYSYALFVLAGLLPWTFFGIWPGWGVLWVPLVLGLLVLAALGVGTLLGALTVAYRDFRYVVPFLVQLWMFATPSIYMEANTAMSPRWRIILPLNPA